MNLVTIENHVSVQTDLKELSPAKWETGVAHLLDCLNPWLEHSFRTRLVAGAGEPIYLAAAVPEAPHQIVFAHGYFSSALHELAHWCLAGPKRRAQDDYGYWYCPDGRNARQQVEFERVEVKPQAVEWWLTAATGRSFRSSTDNLNGTATDSRPFRQAVQQQAQRYAKEGLPVRAGRAVDLLCEAFQNERPDGQSFSGLPL